MVPKDRCLCFRLISSELKIRPKVAARPFLLFTYLYLRCAHVRIVQLHTILFPRCIDESTAT